MIDGKLVKFGRKRRKTFRVILCFFPKENQFPSPLEVQWAYQAELQVSGSDGSVESKESLEIWRLKRVIWAVIEHVNGSQPACSVYVISCSGTKFSFEMFENMGFCHRCQTLSNMKFYLQALNNFTSFIILYGWTSLRKTSNPCLHDNN